MFSNDKVSNLFTDFGIALVNDDSPKVFTSLNALIGKVKEYGELKGRLPTILGRLERYPVTVPTAWSIGVVVFVVAYFIISGHILPLT